MARPQPKRLSPSVTKVRSISRETIHVFSEYRRDATFVPIRAERDRPRFRGRLGCKDRSSLFPAPRRKLAKICCHAASPGASPAYDGAKKRPTRDVRRLGATVKDKRDGRSAS